MAATVNETVGKNVKRVRVARGLNGREFIARLDDRGMKLLPSGLTATEKGERRLTVEELLTVAQALNTSVIDLLVPESDEELVIAEGVEPLHPSWLESWLMGRTPWPPDPQNVPYVDQFFSTATPLRKYTHRTELRPEIHALRTLESTVRNAILGPGPMNGIEDPKLMAELLRDELGHVTQYVELLAARLETGGYFAPG